MANDDVVSTPEGSADESSRDMMLRLYSEAEGEKEVTEELPVAEAEEEAEPAEESEEAEEEDDIEPPAMWSAEDKERFKGLNRADKEFLVRRERDMTADYTRKTQDLAAQRRFAEEMHAAIEPYRAEMAAAGVPAGAIVQQMLEYKRMLDQNPKETLKLLMQRYNVSVGAEEEVYLDPVEQKLMGKLETIEQKLAREEQQRARQEQQALQEAEAKRVEAVKQFAMEKDDKGEAKHPHFQSVWQEMAALMESGLATNLLEAYEKSCRLAGLTHSPAKVNPPKKTAKEAKIAASGVKSSTVPVVKQEFRSRKDEMLALYREASKQ